jgi:4-amino-4-deoxy-L-arabinose transferase-like glycosyltransferase
MRYQVLTLGVVTALAGFLRLYGLGDRCLWLDEVLSWRLAQFDVGETVSRLFNPFECDNPPLFFVLLRPWMLAFGDSEFMLRLPSALAGIASVPAMFLFVRELARLRLPCDAAPERGGWEGVAAAALLALSELHVTLARQVRMYSLGTVLFLLSSWALLRATRPDARFGWWALYGVLALAFLYLHWLALFSVTAQCAFAGIVLIANRLAAGDAAREANRRLVAFALTGVLLAVAYAPGALLLWSRATEPQPANSWMGPFILAHASQQSVQALISSEVARQLESSTAGLLVVLGVAYVVVLFVLRTGRAGVFVALTVTVPVALMAVHSVRSDASLFVARYLTFALVPWLAAVPLAAAQFPRPVAVGVFLVGGIWWIAWSLPCVNAIVNHDANPGMRAAADLIRAQRAPEDPVFTQRVGTQMKLAYCTQGWCRPHQIAVIPSKDLHNGLFMRSDELLSPDVLAADGVTGFWLLSSSGYGEREGVCFPLPGRWRRTYMRRFDQDYPWEGKILAEHYRRE